MKEKEKLQKSWIWKNAFLGQTGSLQRKSINEFIEDKIEGYSINVCAGQNPLCDINLDLDPKDKTILRGDMRNLPFEDNTFDTVISDPPWKISYYERMRPFFECVRICKVGGKIIYNATWIPESADVEIEKIYFRQDNSFSNISVIVIFKKVRVSEAHKKYSKKIQEEKDEMKEMKLSAYEYDKYCKSKHSKKQKNATKITRNNYRRRTS